ncbi:protoheme IX farnesyltransferase, partial [Azospirillum sp. Sp 7]|uniref:UbiA family prenyltransferase n=1 Tax=Azospirillum sp. Sp 7 TaxID=1685931 RepID=UPI000D60902B
NIVMGGAAGAFPPMIGWAAVTGGVELPSILLFLLIFLWTPPHFWALALFRNGDYTRAGVPMMPVVAGPDATKRQMLAYTLVLLPVAVAPYFLGIGGLAYLIGSSLLGAFFVLCAVRVLRATDDKPAKQMFGFSILYLFLLFALLMGEHLVSGILTTGGGA